MEVSRCVQTLVDQISHLQETRGRPSDGLGQLSLSRSVSGQHVMEVSRCVQTLVDQISDLQETHGRCQTH